MINHCVLSAPRMVDLRKIIKYYENNKERNMKDFLNEFQEYSGY